MKKNIVWGIIALSVISMCTFAATHGVYAIQNGYYFNRWLDSQNNSLTIVEPNKTSTYSKRYELDIIFSRIQQTTLLVMCVLWMTKPLRSIQTRCSKLDDGSQL